MTRTRSILLAVTMLSGLMPTAAMAEWGQQQCLSSARICRGNCEREAKSCYAGCRDNHCRERCGTRTHECIYVTCDTEPCFKLR